MAILQTIELVQGEERTFVFNLTNKKIKTPYDMTGVTGTTLKLKLATSGLLSLTGTTVSADLAKISFTISEAESATLLAGNGLHMQLEINKGSVKTIKKIQGMLNVLEALS